MDKRRQDLSFCWEQILALDPWFKLNFLFAPAELKDGLLAVHAIFASIDHALRIGEESLCRARLAWLAQELELAGQSAFPVVRLLHASGALERIPRNLLVAMMEDAHMRVEAGRPASSGELKIDSSQTGWTRMAVELSLTNREGAAINHIDEHCAGSGAHYLMRVSQKESGEALGLIPLDLLARHQVSTGELSGASESVRACRDDFLASVRSWAEEQKEALENLERRADFEGAALLHPVAFSAACALRAQKMEFLSGEVNVPRWGAGDLFRVWSGCRRLQAKR